MFTKICDLQFRHNQERMISQVSVHTYSSPSSLQSLQHLFVYFSALKVLVFSILSMIHVTDLFIFLTTFYKWNYIVTYLKHIIQHRSLKD